MAELVNITSDCSATGYNHIEIRFNGCNFEEFERHLENLQASAGTPRSLLLGRISSQITDKHVGRVLQQFGTPLRFLTIDDLCGEVGNLPGITDHTLMQISLRCPNLCRLRIRHAPLISDGGLEHFLLLKPFCLRDILINDAVPVGPSDTLAFNFLNERIKPKQQCLQEARQATRR